MALLFNMSELNELLISFYTLTKLRIAIFDEDFHELLAYPSRLSTYCQIIRARDETNEKCKACDYNAYQACKSSNSLYVYTCHAGLTEAIAPIKSESRVIGYIMFGQVFCSDENTISWKEIYEKFKDYSIDIEALHKAYLNKAKIEPKVIKSSAQMLEICANYLYSSHKLKQEDNSLVVQIDNYIIEHMHEPITVPDLCEHFKIRKTTFYKISSDFFGMGLAEYIRQVKIQRAKQYLTDTNLPICEIADLVGISDYNYFTKVFKREVKYTPTEFRKISNLTYSIQM
ncbi:MULTISPECIES: PocR ligand-binding domain-containing protein [Bacteria]|uniref:PocR ligand-binding domain-containing protein n=1 Tax=Bacteria TaxID=2 RepID=UPI0012B17737|nr:MULTISPECIES: PocR ligand-binding domain-containing protein [Bacteria]MRY42783.1 helix-turn-helix domain-containing protein [Parabacteroides distasonis]MZK52089.1 helix-turn-helix domain-containing protein [Clostridium beijerinckii]MZK60230.1 helix-turn-helix domain-containing protein [Clostridium beijerinckii]MZK70515.1 helix-turn-helix domain-containing protein [Clostridium beijerinckii]MZK75817.1 helix-turn-helix domain-containing protein [Clostridium beijerinckii]